MNAQHSVQGRVTNASGEPLEFALVFLENTSWAAVTDATGSYSISDIISGQYNLKVTHTAYESESKQITVSKSLLIDIQMLTLSYALNSIEIIANKMGNNDPFIYEETSKKDLAIQNVGIDLPTTLQNITSITTTSDAGHGIGYSALSLRGSDQTRINVTINGVPVNDAESQNVFWVNMPDLLSSSESIQIQRGIGSSTNGPGAFGGSLVINTKSYHQNSYAIVSSTGGSFGTFRGNVGLGTGIMNDKYYLEGRYSYIKSDGFIDRANSRLNGLYLAAGMIKEKSSMRFQVISGKEITYQAWNGIPEAKINGTSEALLQHFERNRGSLYITPQDSMNLFQSDNRYNYYTYENQVDNYRQTQAQLSYNLSLSQKISLSATGFYTFGTGYFEQFKQKESLADYGFDQVLDETGKMITTADLARRKWLKNHYIGIIVNAKGEIGKRISWQAGAFGSQYIGNHFGEIVKVWFNTPTNIWSKYYDNQGEKADISAYARTTWSMNDKLSWFGDVQLRSVLYSITGLLEDFIPASIDDQQLFFNPKSGLSYQWNSKNKIFGSLAVGHKELSRSDYVDHVLSPNDPTPERMVDYEVAYQFLSKNFQIRSGVYYMDYKNQLVLNGNLNDVGAPLRINVPDSYRLGLETEITYTPDSKWKVALNGTFSQNKILDFTETLYDYTNGFEVILDPKGTTPIAYSPSVICNAIIEYKPWAGVTLIWNSKYVSSQYLDNTGNDQRSLPAYHIHGFRSAYTLKPGFCKELTFQILANNILNLQYSSFGYTYSYIYSDLITENFYFPQAGINLYGGVSIKF